MKLRLPFGYVLELRKVATAYFEPGAVYLGDGFGGWHRADEPDIAIDPEAFQSYVDYQWKTRGWKEDDAE